MLRFSAGALKKNCYFFGPIVIGILKNELFIIIIIKIIIIVMIIIMMIIILAILH